MEERVLAARRVDHATQRRYASLVGVSVEAVRAWEAGRRTPEGPTSKIIRLIRKNHRLAALIVASCESGQLLPY